MAPCGEDAYVAKTLCSIDQTILSKTVRGYCGRFSSLTPTVNPP